MYYREQNDFSKINKLGEGVYLAPENITRILFYKKPVKRASTRKLIGSFLFLVLVSSISSTSFL